MIELFNSVTVHCAWITQHWHTLQLTGDLFKAESKWVCQTASAYPRCKIRFKLFCRLLCLNVFSVDENCIIYVSGTNSSSFGSLVFVTVYLEHSGGVCNSQTLDVCSSGCLRVQSGGSHVSQHISSDAYDGNGKGDCTYHYDACVVSSVQLLRQRCQIFFLN